jgi:hypothetical protein
MYTAHIHTYITLKAFNKLPLSFCGDLFVVGGQRRRRMRKEGVFAMRKMLLRLL